MFYARINKIKVFNNREGFLGLFNSAEMRIYGYAAGYAGTGQPSDLTLGDLAALPDDASRRELLLQRTAAEIDRFTQSVCLEIDGVKDNQDLTFGDAGLVIYQHETIPDTLLMQLWVIESDADIRLLTADADALLDSDEFRAVLTAVNAMLIAANPVLGTVIGVGRVAVNLLRKKLRANRDDLAGYWQATLNRAEHYPYGTRDRLDVPDTTGNIRVDYTLFGFNRIENGELRMENVGSVMTDAVSYLSPGPSPQGRGETEDTVPVVMAGSAPATATAAVIANGVKQSSAQASVPENTSAQAPSPTELSPPLWGGVGGEVKPLAPGGEVDFVQRIYPAARHLYETRDGLHPLFVTAQAALETGWKIKAPGNNIFGITRGVSWTGPVNLLLTTDVFNTPDKRFSPMEKVVSVEQTAPDRYRYTVYREFRAYASLEDSLEDHLALLRGLLYRDAWPCRHDPREYARRIAPTYATGPDYAATLVAVIDRVERVVTNYAL